MADIEACLQICRQGNDNDVKLKKVCPCAVVFLCCAAHDVVGYALKVADWSSGACPVRALNGRYGAPQCRTLMRVLATNCQHPQAGFRRYHLDV
jgi:hypothetical protein